MSLVKNDRQNNNIAYSLFYTLLTIGTPPAEESTFGIEKSKAFFSEQQQRNKAADPLSIASSLTRVRKLFSDVRVQVDYRKDLS
jgi:hypothetical protein